jgi:hypothetical protein
MRRAGVHFWQNILSFQKQEEKANRCKRIISFGPSSFVSVITPHKLRPTYC